MAAHRIQPAVNNPLYLNANAAVHFYLVPHVLRHYWPSGLTNSLDHASHPRGLVRHRGNIPAVIWSVCTIVISALVWIPFFKLAERKQLEMEAAEENLHSEAEKLADPIL